MNLFTGTTHLEDNVKMRNVADNEYYILKTGNYHYYILGIIPLKQCKKKSRRFKEQMFQDKIPLANY